MATMQSFRQRIFRAVKADPKKTCALVVLVTTLGMMWVRMAMKHRETPAFAATNTKYIAPDNILATMGDKPDGAPDRWLRAEIPPLSRNLFGIKLDNFPRDGSAPQTNETSTTDGFWDQLAKSMATRADLKQERAALVENIHHDASQLRLQSIVMGAKPRAVINGDMVGEGDIVASASGEGRTFRVLKIESRRIIVEREGIKLEIQMN
jgi:hypothetical protein